MPDLADGESVEVSGSGARPYVLKNVGGVYSCTCPAWRNQSTAIERRTCKHLRRYRGETAEEARLGAALPRRPVAEKEPGGGKDGTAGPPLLLAESWDNSIDLSGWWMSEKLDGVRAYWDGAQFLSRQGNRYHAPDWFTEGLPEAPLDGELWIGRRAFQRTVSIVRRQDKSEHWKSVRYVVFDAPAAQAAFEERLEYLKDGVRSWKNAYLSLHEHALCESESHLRQQLEQIEALGGEGLMLRQPGSLYTCGRSATLLKVKRFHDAEAEVVRHEPGKGRHAGRLGALAVRLSNGKEFSVGTGFADRERDNPPPVGSWIRFRYQELSDAGIPRFPSYIGLRTDVIPAIAQPIVGGIAEPAPAAHLIATATIAAKSTSTVAGTPLRRYFEFVEGASSKFWEVRAEGADLITRWGRIGAAGQTKTKSFATPEKAQAERDRLVAEKLGNGYLEVQSIGSTAEQVDT